jgi:hypothetical protein
VFPSCGITSVTPPPDVVFCVEVTTSGQKSPHAVDVAVRRGQVQRRVVILLVSAPPPLATERSHSRQNVAIDGLVKKRIDGCSVPVHGSDMEGGFQILFASLDLHKGGGGGYFIPALQIHI